VHRAIGEQGEDGGADVTAARPWPTSAAARTEATIARELLSATAPGMARMV
jgi:hypothetical protein